MNPKISIHLTTQTEQDDPTIPSVMFDKWSALIEIKAEYSPANSGLFLFECSGIIV